MADQGRAAIGASAMGTGTMGIRPAAAGGTAVVPPVAAPQKAAEDRPLDRTAAIRLTLWGVAAATSAAIAIFAASTDLGTKRAGAAVAAIVAPPLDSGNTITQIAARNAETERETRRLLDTVKALSADRERIASRVDSVEREMDGLTGSINRVAAQVRQPLPPVERTPPPEIRPTASAPSVPQPSSAKTGHAPSVIPPVKPVVKLQQDSAETPAHEGGPSMLNLAMTTPVFGLDARMPPTAWPRQQVSRPGAILPPETASVRQDPDTDVPVGTVTAASADTGTPQAHEPQPKVELGVDLGPGLTMAKLRARWDAFKAAKGAEANRMHPLVMAREVTPGKPVELRLIVGPVADIRAAAELCASLVGTQFLCQPSVYDGQRLALR